METEKKAKRPRIGATLSATASENAEGETRYEKVNYPGDNAGHTPSERPQMRQTYGDRPYQPRQQYNNYRQGGYSQNRYGNNYGMNQGYQPRQQQFDAQNPQANQEAGESGESTITGQPMEGGYVPRQRNNYQQRPYNNYQGGYNQNRQGGYNQNRQAGYNNQNRQGGYNNQNRQGGYNQNRQGGYNQNRQGGYNQGGYNPNYQGGYNQGGYNPNYQGGYNQGGYKQNRQGGYNNNNRKQKNRNNSNNIGGGYNPKGMRFTPRPKAVDYVLNDIDPNEPIRLNKYMANAGVCSRREADEHITAGLVKVNGEVVTELGTKISRTDVVEYNDKVVTPERKCYILLNKPKDCVTTSDDPNGRTTVLDLVKNACQERIYPVGRLDRNTTGVLLLTNDGDLASKLTHPKFVKKKIYHVWTNKDISEDDMQRIADGIELEDGEIHADAISYVTDKDRNQAGIEIHSGRNRIVRRIFESLGYRVTKLDRVYFAGLTKKNLARGKWRYLSQEEVNYLRQGSFE